MSEGGRPSRVSEEFREILAEEILKLKDPRVGFVTVTGVRMTPDLRLARVSYTVARRRARPARHRCGVALGDAVICDRRSRGRCG